jgi:predicted dehydrogenase|tara:strand:- start:25369 stop:26346 length:978 start_codon:yes stop_codon:yes gene_type:complete
MKYKVAIIGLGNIGLLYDKEEFHNKSKFLTHTKTIYHSEDFELIGGIDLDHIRRKYFNELTNCNSYKSINHLKKERQDVDVFVLSTSTESHLKVLQEILSNYNPKVILCEKPLSYKINECEKIIELCQKHKTELFINFPRRIEKSIVAMKKMIKKSEYFKGTVWYSNGTINNGIHFIDIIMYLFGTHKNLELISVNHVYKDRDDFDSDFKILFENGEIYFFSWPEYLFSNYKIEIFSKKKRFLYDNNGYKTLINKVVSDPYFNGHKYISTQSESIENNINTSMISVYQDILHFLNGDENKCVLNNIEQILNIHYIINQLKLKING